ncbi:MAG: 6-bladed beta-propeller [Candidatus Omnitrophota bacterium]
MNTRFFRIIFIICLYIAIGQAYADIRFSLGEYLVDDEPYSECFKEGKNGNIYISDKQTHFIRVFSPEGKYLYSLGGKGEGPGEFKRWRGAYDIDLKGEICQIDFVNGNRRITRFLPDGKLIESFPVKDPKIAGATAIFKRPNGDYIVNFWGGMILEHHSSLNYMGTTDSISILDGKGGLKEMVHETKTFHSFSGNANGSWIEIPYLDMMVSAYSPTRDTLAFQRKTDDHVTILDLRRKKTIRIPNGFKISPLTKQDIDCWIEERKTLSSVFNVQLKDYQKFRSNGTNFITNKAIVDRLFFNNAGELFISHYNKIKKKYIVNKFSTGNKHLETKSLDKIPAYIGKSRIYYMIYNENDETYTIEVKSQDRFFN